MKKFLITCFIFGIFCSAFSEPRDRYTELTYNGQKTGTNTNAISLAQEKLFSDAEMQIIDDVFTVKDAYSGISPIIKDGISGISFTSSANIAALATGLTKIILQNTGGWNNTSATITDDVGDSLMLVTTFSNPFFFSVASLYDLSTLIPTIDSLTISYMIIPPNDTVISVSGYSGVSMTDSQQIKLTKDTAAGVSNPSPDKWAMGNKINDAKGNNIGGFILWSNFAFDDDTLEFVNAKTTARAALNIPSAFTVDLSYANADNSDTDYRIQNISILQYNKNEIKYIISLGYKSNDQVAALAGGEWVVTPTGLYLLNLKTDSLASALDVPGFNPVGEFVVHAYDPETKTIATEEDVYSSYEQVMQNLPVIKTTDYDINKIGFNVIGIDGDSVKFRVAPSRITNLPAVSEYSISKGNSQAFGGDLFSADNSKIGTVVVYASGENSQSILPTNINDEGVKNLIITQKNFYSQTINNGDNAVAINVAYTPAEGYDFNIAKSPEGVKDQEATLDLQLTKTPASTVDKIIKNVKVNFYDRHTGTLLSPQIEPIALPNPQARLGSGFITSVENCYNPIPSTVDATNIEPTLVYTTPPKSPYRWAFGGQVYMDNNYIGTMLVTNGGVGNKFSQLDNIYEVMVGDSKIIIYWNNASVSSKKISRIMYAGFDGGTLILNAVVTTAQPSVENNSNTSKTVNIAVNNKYTIDSVINSIKTSAGKSLKDVEVVNIKEDANKLYATLKLYFDDIDDSEVMQEFTTIKNTLENDFDSFGCQLISDVGNGVSYLENWI
ncbi:hypothetical protein [Francisella sciaenopsi]|uniref:Uncharacterized protein n=1 Tax=Francisella sciaenopsi TaxID=3055034 RepID=A0ABQ6PIG3_9GAMM